MDFLDPDKKRIHRRKLAIGYVLVGILIIMATLILLYQANGYRLNKKGQVVQNGLVFVTSTPNPASIYLNGVLNKAKTNARLDLPAGQYTLKIQRSGYRVWQRALGVEGDSVERFDYPFLFPTTLSTSTVQQYTTQPGLTTQSPDRRWLLVEQSPANGNFNLYDLSNRKLPATVMSIPISVLGNSSPTTGWQLEEWSTDNRHVVLIRQYVGGQEYILFDTQTPADSVNLSQTLGLTPTDQITLRNKQYNQYFVYDTATDTLGTDSQSTPAVTLMLSHVLAYKSYGTNVILYATDSGAASGKAVIRLLEGSKNVAVRSVVSGSSYLLNLTQFNGVWYVAAGAAAEDRVYIYQDPVGMLSNNPNQPLVPLDILKVTEPNDLEFSANARFIMTESSQSFAVYDILNDKSYSYQLNMPVADGIHATWMDGDRLMLASNNQVVVFDYDDANQQTLEPAQTGSLPFFDTKYQYLYAIAPADATTGTINLTRTAMTVPPTP